jgi:curved DNA-binding protein
MDFKDYYATLGVAKTAAEKEIKQAYRKLARKYHPDVNPGDKAAESRFKDINEAYEVLGDADKRKKYDELGANWRMYEQAQQAGGSRSPFGGQWGYAPGGAGGGFRTMSEEDVEHDIELDLEDALKGSVQRLGIQHDGQVRNVEVRIPAGVTEGSRVRVSGEGERGSGTGGSGDLYLRVRLRPHPRFERKGRDLYTKVRVPVTTAVLGGEVEVPTLSGKSLRLKIPPATQNNQVFRLRGHGLPAGKGGEGGDLYATVDVAVPQALSEDERKHYEALAELTKGRVGG